MHSSWTVMWILSIKGHSSKRYSLNYGRNSPCIMTQTAVSPLLVTLGTRWVRCTLSPSPLSRHIGFLRFLFSSLNKIGQRPILCVCVCVCVFALSEVLTNPQPSETINLCSWFITLYQVFAQFLTIPIQLKIWVIFSYLLL